VLHWPTAAKFTCANPDRARPSLPLAQRRRRSDCEVSLARDFHKPHRAPDAYPVFVNSEWSMGPADTGGSHSQCSRGLSPRSRLYLKATSGESLAAAQCRTLSRYPTDMQSLKPAPWVQPLLVSPLGACLLIAHFATLPQM